MVGCVTRLQSMPAHRLCSVQVHAVLTSRVRRPSSPSQAYSQGAADDVNGDVQAMGSLAAGEEGEEEEEDEVHLIATAADIGDEVANLLYTDVVE